MADRTGGRDGRRQSTAEAFTELNAAIRQFRWAARAYGTAVLEPAVAALARWIRRHPRLNRALGGPGDG